MLPSEYLSERLTPYPLPTKDGGVLRTVGDARAYILALPKTRMARAHWKRASLLLQEEVGAAALTLSFPRIISARIYDVSRTRLAW
jgi:hypothetical protein